MDRPVTDTPAKAARAVFDPVALGVVAQLMFAGTLTIASTTAGGPSPEPIPRGLALGLLYAAPAVVALLGIRGGRRSLLVAAAIVDFAGAPLSWSGLTLLFLVPAILFVGATGRLPSRPSTGLRGRLAGIAVALVVPGLLVAAGVGLLALTEPLCWIATPGPGGYTFRIVPSIDDVPISVVGEIGGCTSAALTLQGLAVAGALAIGALALAWLAAVGPGRVRTRAGAPGTG